MRSLRPVNWPRNMAEVSSALCSGMLGSKGMADDGVWEVWTRGRMPGGLAAGHPDQVMPYGAGGGVGCWRVRRAKRWPKACTKASYWPLVFSAFATR